MARAFGSKISITSLKSAAALELVGSAEAGADTGADAGASFFPALFAFGFPDFGAGGDFEKVSVAVA
jgi:hypothetical protein